jgi:Arc/MetJ-type ribon-helix-helix transcriptional regulator
MTKMREGLRLLQEREAKFQRLKRDIEIGLESGPGEVESFADMAKAARAEWERRRQRAGNRQAAD